jgi:hypothetical protein
MLALRSMLGLEREFGFAATSIAATPTGALLPLLPAALGELPFTELPLPLLELEPELELLGFFGAGWPALALPLPTL